MEGKVIAKGGGAPLLSFWCRKRHAACCKQNIKKVREGTPHHLETVKKLYVTQKRDARAERREQGIQEEKSRWRNGGAGKASVFLKKASSNGKRRPHLRRSKQGKSDISSSGEDDFGILGKSKCRRRRDGIHGVFCKKGRGNRYLEAGGKRLVMLQRREEENFSEEVLTRRENSSVSG